jgi:hypothetical protein
MTTQDLSEVSIANEAPESPTESQTLVAVLDRVLDST